MVLTTLLNHLYRKFPSLNFITDNCLGTQHCLVIWSEGDKIYFKGASKIKDLSKSGRLGGHVMIICISDPDAINTITQNVREYLVSIR